MRIMGLDYGSVTVGVAISDELLLTAQGIETIRRKKENQLRQTFQRIEELIKEYGTMAICSVCILIGNSIVAASIKADGRH